MNWEAIRQIYTNILKYKNSIEYLGDDKYRISSYYKSGKKHWEAEFKNSEYHGKTLFRYENGNRDVEFKYKDGLLHGKTIHWKTDGTIHVEHEYQNGKFAK